MSLSSWLLDYLFRPLQLGLRDWRRWGTPVALLATFFLSGLWHGATWSFLAWGGLHGLFLATAALSRPWRQRHQGVPGGAGSRLLAAAQVIVTFHLICFAWVFFRASSLQDALDAVRLAALGLPGTLQRVFSGLNLDHLLYSGGGKRRSWPRSLRSESAPHCACSFPEPGSSGPLTRESRRPQGAGRHGPGRRSTHSWRMACLSWGQLPRASCTRGSERARPA